MLTTSYHLLALSIFGSSFQQDLSQHFPRKQCEADWSLVPQILILALLDRSDICCLSVLRNLHYELSKIIRSASQ